MMNIFLTIEAGVAILLSICILMQHRVSGLTQTFGGSGAVYVQRRGAEKVIYKLTIILSVAFFSIAVLLWYLPS
ncbi:preprotein translocase subunit SecG [Candidatus Peribacteria bacterium]|nr:preprotein translocase subunit SecG [Candidatus Peribacteria bacterium]